MPDQSQQLVQLLLNMMTRLDALERTAHASGPASSLPTLADTIQAFAREGQGPSSPVGNGLGYPTEEPQPQPYRPPLPGGSLPDDPFGAAAVPPRLAPRQRAESPPVPRSGIDFSIEVPAGRPYTTAPPPQEAALEGRQFIRCSADDWVQVRTEDGKLLGAMPAFPEDVQVVYTELRQEMSVGMLAVRAVVVPYNRGIDPRTIVGFVPAPGLEEGPLTTGPSGRGANLDNPDIGQRP